MSAKITPERIEDRVVRHDFTPAERLELGSELARALGRLRGVEAEFEGVKASFKARIATEESTVETKGFRDAIAKVETTQGQLEE